MARTEMLMTFDRQTRKVGLRIENGYEVRADLKSRGFEFTGTSAWTFAGTNREIVDRIEWAMGAGLTVLRADGKTPVDADFFGKLRAAA